MRAIGEVLAASLLLLFIAAFAVLAYIDQCPQHSSAQSRSIADKIDSVFALKATFTVQDGMARPIRLLLLCWSEIGHVRHPRFASTINSIAVIRFFCGF